MDTTYNECLKYVKTSNKQPIKLLAITARLVRQMHLGYHERQLSAVITDSCMHFDNTTWHHTCVSQDKLLH